MRGLLGSWTWWALVLFLPVVTGIAWLNGDCDSEPTDCYVDGGVYYCDPPQEEPFDRDF